MNFTKNKVAVQVRWRMRLEEGGMKAEGFFFFFNCGQDSNYLVEITPVTFKHWVVILNICIFRGKRRD